MSTSIASELAHIKTVDAHVLIHGTRFSGLAFASAVPFLQKKLSENNLYTIAVRSSRDDERLKDSQPMDKCGLVEIPERVIIDCRRGALPCDVGRQAVVHVLNGFDAQCDHTKTKNYYYTFGWDGLLEDKHRKESSGVLYSALVDLIQTLTQKYPGAHVRLLLYAHSHGGNLVLYLAHHEKEQNKHLVIDCACLFGTPIQKETAPFAQHDMFKTIMSFYSNGDHIQTADKISTESHTSERRLSSFTTIKNTPQKRIIDVCVRTNGDDRALNHASFYFMDMYSIAKRSLPQVIQALRPLPIIMFAPTMRRLTDQLLSCSTTHEHAFLDFIMEDDNPNELIMWVVGKDGMHVQRSGNLLTISEPVKQMVEQLWRPVAFYGMANVARLAFSGLANSIPEYISRFIDGEKI